jgi:uncharacterized protein YrrD
MKLRNVKNLPVFLKDTAEIVGRVVKAVVGDDYRISYLVVTCEDQTPGIIFRDDFSLAREAVIIDDCRSIKSYAHGEELSVYEKKLGDQVFDHQGKELGVVSDFVINRAEKTTWGMEVSSGLIVDILDGRREIPLDQIRWASNLSAVVNPEGSVD